MSTMRALFLGSYRPTESVNDLIKLTTLYTATFYMVREAAGLVYVVFHNRKHRKQLEEMREFLHDSAPREPESFEEFLDQGGHITEPVWDKEALEEIVRLQDDELFELRRRIHNLEQNP